MNPDSELMKKVLRVDFHWTPCRLFLLNEMTETIPSFPEGDMHLDPQIIMILDGAFEMHYRNFHRMYLPGELCITGPWEPHRARIPDCGCHYLVLTLDLCAMGTFSPFQDVDWLEIFLQAPDRRPVLNQPRQKKNILKIAAELMRLENNKIHGYQTRQWIKILDLLWEISQAGPHLESHPQSSDFLRIYPAIQLIQNNITEIIPQQKAAVACGLGVSRFSEIFKKTLKISFHQYSDYEKIRAITRKMKLQHFLSMKQIADQFKFSSTGNFHRYFKRVTGLTPREFMQQNEQKISRKNIGSSEQNKILND